jgi:hypothetical protein
MKKLLSVLPAATDAGSKTALDMAAVSSKPHGAEYRLIGECVSDVGEMTIAGWR